MRIGVQIVEPTAPESISAVERAEKLGIQAAWMTLGGARPDSIAMMAVAATQTASIQLGTCIAPFYPRHPIAMAQTARVVAEIAPGRFRLGIGPSHKPLMEKGWGIPYDRPVSRLDEYLQVLAAALKIGGRVNFQGQFYQANIDVGAPLDIQIMASALREKSYRLAGEKADGAISWVSPLAYIATSAIPAIASGAKKAARKKPLMVMHLPVVVHEQAAEVREAATQLLAGYPRMVNYQEMFAQAGFPEAREGTWSQGMLDAVVVHGSEQTVAARLREIAAAGVDEVICSLIAAGPDPTASMQRTLRFLGDFGSEQTHR